MKIIVNSQGKLNFEIEVGKQTEAWEELSSIREVFGDRVCRRCKTDDAEFFVRIAKSKNGKQEYQYHELHCRNPKCNAIKAYSVIHDGTYRMYPKIKVNNGDPMYEDFVKNEGDEWAYLPYEGWMIYNSKTGKKE